MAERKPAPKSSPKPKRRQEPEFLHPYYAPEQVTVAIEDVEVASMRIIRGENPAFSQIQTFDIGDAGIAIRQKCMQIERDIYKRMNK